MAAIVEHRKFICVNFENTNNNKYWQYTLYDDGTALTEWGRVGKKQGDKVVSHSKALAKMREKTRDNNAPDKRYTEVKVAEGSESSITSNRTINNGNLKSIAHKQIDIKDPTLKELIDFLIKENIHQIVEASQGAISYDTSTAQFKTPLGVILPEQVSDARNLLEDMADFVMNSDYNDRTFNRMLNEYLRLIPHDVGMSKITPKLIFPSPQSLKSENNLLDGLEVSFNDIQTNTSSNSDKEEKDTLKLFDVSLDVVRDKRTINRIKTYYENTKKTMHQSHRYKLHKIYKVDIHSVGENFEKIGKKIGNTMELFHGTKCSNLLSILKKGLIIPSSSSYHVTGRLYGDGVYGSDISSKALNYATNFWGGGGSTDRIFMFLCDFAMGKIYYPTGKYGVTYPPKGYDSTFAKAGQAGVYNNEMIVYNTYQVNLKYLLEFK